MFLGLRVQVGGLDIWQDNQEDRVTHRMLKTMPLLNKNNLRVQLWRGMKKQNEELVLRVK